MVKKNTIADKRACLDGQAEETEEAAHHGNMRAVYSSITNLSGIFNMMELSLFILLGGNSST